MVRKKGIEMLDDEEEMMKLTQASMDITLAKPRVMRGAGLDLESVHNQSLTRRPSHAPGLCPVRK